MTVLTQLRFAWRMLRKNPTTSVLAVIALGLGIGLTTSMFSVVHGLLFSRLPFAEPDRLMDLVSYAAEAGPLGVSSAEVPVHPREEGEEPWRTVVGVVPDAGVSLLNPAFVGTTQAGFYVPQAQLARRGR